MVRIVEGGALRIAANTASIGDGDTMGPFLKRLASAAVVLLDRRGRGAHLLRRYVQDARSEWGTC